MQALYTTTNDTQTHTIPCLNRRICGKQTGYTAYIGASVVNPNTKSLNSAERNYEIYDKELLAIVKAIN